MTVEAVTEGEFLVDVSDGIVTATFNRPQARNAFTFAMYEHLAALCARIDEDRSVKALVLTGACLLYTSPSPRDS